MRSGSSRKLVDSDRLRGDNQRPLEKWGELLCQCRLAEVTPLRFAAAAGVGVVADETLGGGLVAANDLALLVGGERAISLYAEGGLLVVP